MDVLGRLIDKAKECNVIQGFSMGRDKVEVTHLQFADDTLFFMEAKPNVFLNYLKPLEAFGSVSRLRVNLKKSTLLGINIDEEMIQHWASFSGCKVGLWAIKYLGLPLVGNPRKIDFWDSMVSKVTKRLYGWKKTYLQRGYVNTYPFSLIFHSYLLPIIFQSTYHCDQRNREGDEGFLLGRRRFSRWGSPSG